MADCCEDGGRGSVTNNSQSASSKRKRVVRKESEAGPSNSQNLSKDKSPPGKRQRKTFQLETQAQGCRVGLRSQTRAAAAAATEKLEKLKKAQLDSKTDSPARAGSKGPKSSSYKNKSTKGAASSGIEGPETSGITAGRETAASKPSRSKANTARGSSAANRKKLSAKQAADSATASTSRSDSDNTQAQSSGSAISSQTFPSGNRKRTQPGKGGEGSSRKQTRNCLRSSSTVSDHSSHSKTTAPSAKGPSIATTGETSSRLKRAAGSSASASQSDQSGSGSTGAPASSSSTSRFRFGRPTPVGSAAAGTAADSGAGSSTTGADMSTPGSGNTINTGNDTAGGGNSAAGGAPPNASGILSEMLRSADAAGAAGGSPSDMMDIQRLQAVLESRGLPPHMLGSLESNMRHIIQRSMSSSVLTKVNNLIKGMQAKDDEGQQLTAVMEMCQVLVMGNEDNLSGFPAKQVVPELVSLLSMEHNFDMMMYACRALYYMLEALPRSSLIVVEAVPALLDKLKCIQCMDVAEQSLSALDRLSKRHNKNLLQAGAISACLMYLDFFSIDAQRYALAVAANCCSNITPDEFHYCRDSLPLLSSKLLTADKRSVDSVCTCLARLVDNLRHDEKLLKELAAHEMLANTLKLLEVSPPVISSPTFTMVIRMFVVMCSGCPELAVCLLRQSVANTLVYLLVGEQSTTSTQVELVSRTPQELFEIVSLIGELMPALPATGLFAVESLLRKNPTRGVPDEGVVWQWKDEKGGWRSYSAIDNKVIETAYAAEEDEVTISVPDMSRMYTIDFGMMQQINEETGTARSVFRVTDASGQKSTSSNNKIGTDARAEVLAEQPELANSFIKSLFGILYEVYSSSAGPPVRHKCLQALLRQIYYASPDLLQDVLVTQPVSSHIASMLASQDNKVVVGALQMADILMRKLPDTFTQYFQRQGVTHQVKLLAICKTSQGEANAAAPSDSVDGSQSPAAKKMSSTESLQTGSSKEKLSASPSSTASSSSKLDGVKSKRYSKRTLRGKNRLEGDTSSSGSTRNKTSSKKEANASSTSSSPSAASGGKMTKPSFLSSLRPSNWGSRSAPESKPAGMNESRAVSTATLMANHKEKVGAWISTHANEFLEEHFSTLNATASKAEGVLHTLTKACEQLTGLDKRGHSATKDREALESIADTVTSEDVSPFEMIHSGIIEKLLSYLTSSTELASTSAISDCLLPLENRLATFMNVFIGAPDVPSSTLRVDDMIDGQRMGHLVNKVMACLHQQEQFQVKVHDLGLGSGSANSNAMKFLSSHQLKCQLQRHPECKAFRAYDGGPVKIDPLAPVHAIENFLIRHGYGKTDGSAAASGVEPISDDEHDDAHSLDDLDDSMPALLLDQSHGKHTLELVIGDKALSYNQTVLQAIRNHSAIEDSDADHGLGSSSVWSHTHTIWYRQVTESCPTSKSSSSSIKKSRADSSTKLRKPRKSPDFYAEGNVSPNVSPLIISLSTSITEKASIKDTCVNSLALIRTLYNINRHWGSFYKVLSYKPVVAESVFISSKLAAKANRQLQDPLVIMTGNIPQWLPQVANCCPFLFPFETRQMLFYVNCFDRDRAMMRLQEASTETMDMDTSGRVAPPRLEKKKKTISRDKLLKQAEGIFEDIGKSKSLLEIQYENEVGTGLGPTLEFYSLVSKELQATDLDIWHGEAIPSGEKEASKSYVNTATGLYPKPLARTVKPAVVNKMRAKFKFIGKLLAKALMDSRILDLPLNPIVYSWLLGQHKMLTPSDLATFDPTLADSYSQIKSLADQVAAIKRDSSITGEEEEKAIQAVGIDDLCLDFTWPGYSQIQLKRGGKDESVTADNIEQYLELLCHWVFSEGIHRQMEALKEGFDCVFPSCQLANFFTANELEQLFCGNRCDQWDVKELFDCCRADHGYTLDSKTVQNLFEILSSYDAEEQRRFLSFVTGSPRLPVGGFRSLNPPLTIVRKAFDASEEPDEFLPSVMTCVNYLKLPDYSRIEIMRAKLHTAASVGQLSFHLS